MNTTYHVEHTRENRMSINKMVQILNNNPKPKCSTLIKILNLIDILNYYIKLPGNIVIKKNAFYTIKNHLLIYILLYKHPNISWSVFPYVEYHQNYNNIDYFIGINLNINGTEFTFHQKIEKTIKNILAPYIDGLPIKEYSQKPSKYAGKNFSVKDMSECVNKLINIIESKNWFIYMFDNDAAWVSRMQHLYTELRIKPAFSLQSLLIPANAKYTYRKQWYITGTKYYKQEMLLCSIFRENLLQIIQTGRIKCDLYVDI